MDWLTCSSFPHASEFSVVLGKSSCHSSFENIQACGMWLASPSELPQDGLYSYKRNIPWNINNWQCYGLSSCSIDKWGMSCLMHASWSSSSYSSWLACYSWMLVKDESLNFPHRCTFAICHKKDGEVVCCHIHLFLFSLMRRPNLRHLSPSQMLSWWSWLFPLGHWDLGLRVRPSVQLQWSLWWLDFSCQALDHRSPFTLVAWSQCL